MFPYLSNLFGILKVYYTTTDWEMSEMSLAENHLYFSQISNTYTVAYSLSYRQKLACFSRGVWDKYRLVIFHNSSNFYRKYPREIR